MKIFSYSSRSLSSPVTTSLPPSFRHTTPQSPFLKSSLSIHGSQSSFLSCLKAPWTMLKWLFIVAPKKLIEKCCPERTSNGKFPKLEATKTIDPNAFSHDISNPNELFIYNAFVRRGSLGRPIDFLKYSIKNTDYLSSCPLRMDSHTPRITCVQGPISCEGVSTDNLTDWYAIFSDFDMWSHCHNVPGRDDHRAAEFPALHHVCAALHPHAQSFLNPRHHEICLMKNVLHLGSIDTQTPFANGQTLSGERLVFASYAEILSRMTVSSSPQPKNLFFFHAPRISFPSGQPYQKQHLEQLFYSAFNAFWAAKQNSPNGQAVIHTGNWGTGESRSGHGVKTSLLIQIAAAHAAGVDVRFYPLDKVADFQAAQLLFNQIAEQQPSMSVDQFLTHLEQHAQDYNLVYAQRNRI